MPKLPTYTAKLDGAAIGVGTGGRRADASDFSGSGAELVAAGRQLRATGNDILAHELQRRRDAESLRKETEALQEKLDAQGRRDAALRGATTVAKGRNDFLEYISALGQKSVTEIPDVVAEFKKRFEDFRDKALVQEEHPDGQKHLAVDLDNLRASLIDNAMRLQANRAGAAVKGAVRDVFSRNAVAVQRDPGQLERLLAEERKLIQTIDMPGLTDADRSELLEARRHVLPGAAISARIAAVSDSRSAKALKTELEKSPRWIELLSGQQYGHALDSLTKDIRQYERAERAERVAAVSERIAERAAGVLNGLSVNEAGGDPKLVRAIRAAENMGRARAEIKSMPFADMVAALRKAEDNIASPGNFKEDAAYAEAVQRAAQERMRAIKDDPAAYAIQNSVPAKKAFDAMVQANYDPAAVRRYATVAAEAQRDLAGPAHTPRLLPKSTVDQVIADVSNLPPEQAAGRMEAMQKQFGPMWAEVLGQMSGKLPPGFFTLGRLTSNTDAHTRVALANALKAGKDLRKNLTDTDAKDVDGRVETELAPYARVVSQAGSAAQTVLREELAAARTLAYQYVARGDSPKEAAKKATRALVFDRYDVSGTFLAPKGMLAQAQREADRVARETPIESFPRAAGGDAALSDQYRRQASMNEARRGFWANVTDLNTGKLGIEWRNSDGTPVVLEGGRRVRVLFDDLKSMPNSPPPSVDIQAP